MPIRARRGLSARAIVLDVMLEGESSWTFLAELKRSSATQDIPVIVATVLGAEERARALGADEFTRKPVDERWLTATLASLARRGPLRKVLVVSGDDVSRYMLRKFVEGTPYAMLDTADPVEGLRLAQGERPSMIFLDLGLPPAYGIAALRDLRVDPRTKGIPVIALSSGELSQSDRAELARGRAAVVEKTDLTRAEALRWIRDALEKTEHAEGRARGGEPLA